MIDLVVAILIQSPQIMHYCMKVESQQLSRWKINLVVVSSLSCSQSIQEVTNEEGMNIVELV